MSCFYLFTGCNQLAPPKPRYIKASECLNCGTHHEPPRPIILMWNVAMIAKMVIFPVVTTLTNLPDRRIRVCIYETRHQPHSSRHRRLRKRKQKPPLSLGGLGAAPPTSRFALRYIPKHCLLLWKRAEMLHVFENAGFWFANVI